MADDAAAPDGELSKSTATEETSTATEPRRAVPMSLGHGRDRRRRGQRRRGRCETADEAATPAKPRMSHVRLATIVGLVAVVVLAGLTGWLGFRAYKSHQADEQRELFLQVGRQGALNLTTIDCSRPTPICKRILDSATGTFYDDFQKRSQPFVEVVKQAQSKSVGTIAEAGLESESGRRALRCWSR